MLGIDVICKSFSLDGNIAQHAITISLTVQFVVGRPVKKRIREESKAIENQYLTKIKAPVLDSANPPSSNEYCNEERRIP